jgi:hypothetical protein
MLKLAISNDVRQVNLPSHTALLSSAPESSSAKKLNFRTKE